MQLEIIPCLNDNYSYLIKDDQTSTVAIIDPSEFNRWQFIGPKSISNNDLFAQSIKTISKINSSVTSTSIC